MCVPSMSGKIKRGFSHLGYYQGLGMGSGHQIVWHSQPFCPVCLGMKRVAVAAWRQVAVARQYLSVDSVLFFCLDWLC